MGMFDDLSVEVPLPDGYESDDGFQTKDLDCNLDAYAIRADGRLEVLRYELVKDEDAPADALWPFKRDNERWDRVPFHGVIRFYTYDRSGTSPLAQYDPTRWHEYEAKFTDGTLVGIAQLPAAELATSPGQRGDAGVGNEPGSAAGE